MLSAALLCGAAAVLVWPPPSRVAKGRRRAALIRGVTAGRTVPAGAAAVGLAAGLGSTPLVALLAMGGVLVTGRAWQRRRSAAADEERVRGLAEALAAFAADLRAGRTAAEAASAAIATGPDGVAASALASALRAPDAALRAPDAALRAPDAALRAPDAALQPSPGSGVWGEAVARTARAVRLSTRTGCSLAAIAVAVEEDLRSRLRQQRELRSAVAAPRASAALLAGLPLIALAMGSGIGADPWGVLTGTPAGQLLLVTGAGLEAAGLWWSASLIRRAVR